MSRQLLCNAIHTAYDWFWKTKSVNVWMFDALQTFFSIAGLCPPAPLMFKTVLQFFTHVMCRAMLLNALNNNSNVNIFLYHLSWVLNLARKKYSLNTFPFRSVLFCPTDGSTKYKIRNKLCRRKIKFFIIAILLWSEMCFVFSKWSS